MGLMLWAALRYGLARVGLFLLTAVLVWSVSGLVGHQLNGLPLALLSALISSLAGYVLFARMRTSLAEQIEAQRTLKTEQTAARRARIENES